MEFKEITEKIIGCAYTVYNTMGFGYLESVYEDCMLIELKKAGLNMESQKRITVHYQGQVVGEFVADIFVEDKIIVELKSVKKLIQAQSVQLVNYLVSTGVDVGLLINLVKKKLK